MPLPSGTLSCEAGCSLKKLEKKARKKRLFFPVDLNIREAQIGGVVAADMAGPRTARYGNLHGNVLGLEVVSGGGGGGGKGARGEGVRRGRGSGGGGGVATESVCFVVTDQFRFLIRATLKLAASFGNKENPK